MTKPAHDADPSWPGFLLAALVAALVILFGAGTASAAAATAAQNRVGAHTLVAQVAVGPGVGIGAGQRLGNDPSAYDSALATGVAAKAGLPQLSAGRSALQAKFKHAGDFGITESRGSVGFDAYEKAVDSFVQASSTTRMLGTYRGNAAILNYNARTAQVVVQAPDGAFISGWQMSPAQLQNVIARGSLGGG